MNTSIIFITEQYHYDTRGIGLVKVNYFSVKKKMTIFSLIFVPETCHIFDSIFTSLLPWKP